MNETGWPDNVTEGLNHTYFYEEVEQSEPLSKEFKFLCFFLYAIIFVVGLVGNVMFCFVVISSPAMKSVTYSLLVNLSIADLLITCLCGTVHVIHSIILGHWPFGSFACYAITYFQAISVFASSYTLIVISFERYMSILHPLKSIIPQGRARYVILAVWIFSLLISIPNPILTKHYELEIKGYWVCTTEINEAFHYYSICSLILQYFFPVILMSVCYSMVATTIWKQRNYVSGASRSVTRELQMMKSKRKMIKMLIVVVVCYTVCWLPFNVYWAFGIIVPSLSDSPSFPYIFTIVHILAVSHTCFNPFIYCWMNIRVRLGFMEVFKKLSPGFGCRNGEASYFRDNFPKRRSIVTSTHNIAQQSCIYTGQTNLKKLPSRYEDYIDSLTRDRPNDLDFRSNDEIEMNDIIRTTSSLKIQDKANSKSPESGGDASTALMSRIKDRTISASNTLETVSSSCSLKYPKDSTKNDNLQGIDIDKEISTSFIEIPKLDINGLNINLSREIAASLNENHYHSAKKFKNDERYD